MMRTGRINGQNMWQSVGKLQFPVGQDIKECSGERASRELMLQLVMNYWWSLLLVLVLLFNM